MKRFLFAIIALMAVVNVKGADVTGALLNVADPVITYTSVDAQNKPITLSAKLYYKDNKNVEFVMINCHPTITHNAGCPSGTDPQMDVVKYMISEGALVVCPDYIGFGQTSSTVHPYMCATLTGRNVLDAYKAAIEYVKDPQKGNRKLNEKYYTINVGYSQGGATALAFQRYLETQATDDDRKLVNLRGSVCGAGPYNQKIVFDVYEKGEGKFASLDYPIYLFYVLNGHKQAFGESTMRKLELEECFTPEFWKYIHEKDGNGKSFIDRFNAKDKTVDELNDELKEKGFNTFEKIVNKDYKKHDSKVYRTIRKTLEQSNLLVGGWTPEKSIIFYHDKAGNDIVVPYACTEAALTRFAGHCSYVDAIENYDYEVTFSWGLATLDKENYLWHAAVFDEIWISSIKYPLQNTVRGLAGLSGQGGYSFKELSHRAFGARFYAQILGVRRILRPDYDDNGKYPGDNNGTADEINIEPSTPKDEFTIAAEATSTEGTGDRVKTAFTYDLPQGKPVFVQFAADVDGYYFGCDAPRYKVELENGEAVRYTPMQDNEEDGVEDFKAGEVYLLSAVDADENNILSMTAGVTMKTVDSHLSWRELNMRKVSTVDGTSYVSNCMPFAYNAPEGATAYAMINMTETTKDVGYVEAKAFEGAVPVGTGSIVETTTVINEPDGKMFVVLEPAVNGGITPIEDNMLRGNYSQVANNKENYLHFGLSNFGNLGFWLYPHLDDVPAYNAYMIKPSSEARGMAIVFDGDVTGIVSINDEYENDNLYNVAGQRVNENAKGIIIKNGKKYLAK